jgi:hypothetical protein
MAIGAFAMKHCSSITAVQQFFADTTSTLVAYIQHNNSSLPAISAVFWIIAAIVPTMPKAATTPPAFTPIERIADCEKFCETRAHSLIEFS